jgi:hypothetical protein
MSHRRSRPFPPRGPQSDRLERCLRQDCDIDPLILRARLLRDLGREPQAASLEQELFPLF